MSVYVSSYEPIPAITSNSRVASAARVTPEAGPRPPLRARGCQLPVSRPPPGEEPSLLTDVLPPLEPEVSPLPLTPAFPVEGEAPPEPKVSLLPLAPAFPAGGEDPLEPVPAPLGPDTPPLPLPEEEPGAFDSPVPR